MYNEETTYYCVGYFEGKVIKAVLSDVSSEEYAKKLFVAMYGCTSIYVCKKASFSDLYFLLREREEEKIQEYRRGSDDMLRQWMLTNPPKEKPAARIKRKYTKRQKPGERKPYTKRK